MLYFFLLYVMKKYILDRYEKEKKVIAYYVNNNERIMGQSNKALHEKYEFRDIRRDEIEQAVRIEAIWLVIVVIDAPRQISMCVRNPAGRCLYSLSIPMIPPHMHASIIRKATE